MMDQLQYYWIAKKASKEDYMIVKRIPAGIYAANCYVLYSENEKEGIVVDPGGDVDDIIKFINENNIDIKHIVLTHGHGDHIGGVSELKNELDVDILIHEADLDMLKSGEKNLSSIMAIGSIEISPDGLLNDGDILEFGDVKLSVIHTPGHTLGGICLYANDSLISGDTLFKDSIGRTDLEGGDMETIIKSIREKLFVLPGHTIVYPGHGPETSIDYESKNNPFLK